MGLLSKLVNVLNPKNFLDPLKIFGGGGKEAEANRQFEAAQKAAADAQKAAADQAAETLKQQTEYNTALVNMQTNAAKVADQNQAGADTANVSNVIAGGTADASSLLRKKKASTLSSTLGINV